MTGPDRPPIGPSLCAICGGPIYQPLNAAYSRDNQPEGRAWFHLLLADQRDYPHNARPAA